MYTKNITKAEIIEILSSDDTKLFDIANEVRKLNKGNSVHLRGLLEFTNICKCNCKYCGLRSENKSIKRYHLSEDEIIASVNSAVNLGFKTIVLQGGEDNYFTIDKLCKIIKKIKEFDVAITLSIGEKTFDEYKVLKEAGVDRYLLRIETTDKVLYKSLHPNMSLENRFKCLENIKKLGFETGTGCLVGLPNQTIESLANDILFFKELDADMVGIGPFIPHPNTPLAGKQPDNFNLALRVMALTRIILPDINIPATTAMETLNPNGRIIALNSGANVVMPNITGVEHRKNYEIYPNKICLNDSAEKCVHCITGKIKSIGRDVSTSKGYRKDKN